MKKKVVKIFASLIEAMKENGFECESPYDIQNFMEDHFDHHKVIEAGLFPGMEGDDED